VVDSRSAAGDTVKHRYALKRALIRELISDVPRPVAAAEIDRNHAPVATATIAVTPVFGGAHPVS
jgi:hypothetical protein